MSLCVKLHLWNSFQCISGDITPHSQWNKRGHWPSLRRHLQHDGVHDKRHELRHHVVNVQFVQLGKTSYRKAIYVSKTVGHRQKAEPCLKCTQCFSTIYRTWVWLKCKFQHRSTNASKHFKNKSYSGIFNAKLWFTAAWGFKTLQHVISSETLSVIFVCARF